MKIPSLLEVIQVQRHDFLNHLQVVSGLLQLNKPERVHEYIKQVCAEMGTLSVISRIQVPELQAVLYIAINEASKYQLEVKLDINSKVVDCTIPGNIIADAVEKCINIAIKHLSVSQKDGRRLVLCITEQEKKIFFKFGLLGLSAEVEAQIEKELKYCRGLSDYGVQVGLLLKTELIEICLSMPKYVHNING